MKRQGFTLVELLIVMAILAIMTTIMVMTINPIAMMQRATDARMKKDLSRIRVAFEEYRSDKKTFPNDLAPDFLVTKLMTKTNCGTGVFAPWLNSWPCDPHGVPYQIMIDSGPKRQWFKVLTKLDNKKDTDIPKGREQSTFNYGVSSTNVLWYDLAGCGLVYREDGQQCFGGAVGYCGPTDNNGCFGERCFVDVDCTDYCRVQCCGKGCN